MGKTSFADILGMHLNKALLYSQIAGPERDHATMTPTTAALTPREMRGDNACYSCDVIAGYHFGC
jgi:hypothetical protein